MSTNEEKSIILSITSLLLLQILFVEKNVQCKKDIVETCASFILKIYFRYIKLKRFFFFIFFIFINLGVIFSDGFGSM